MKKYIPHIAIALIIFFAGRYSKDDTSPELIKKLEQERETFTEAISQKDAQIVRLTAAQDARAQQWYQDSSRMMNDIQAKEQAALHYKKLYENINLRNASVADLDSIRAYLLANPLPPIR